MHTDTTIGTWPWTTKTSDDAEIMPKRKWNKWKIYAGMHQQTNNPPHKDELKQTPPSTTALKPVTGFNVETLCNNIHGCTHMHLHDEQVIDSMWVWKKEREREWMWMCVCVCTYLTLDLWSSMYEWLSLAVQCTWGHLPKEPWHHCCRLSAASMGSAFSHKHKNTHTHTHNLVLLEYLAKVIN